MGVGVVSLISCAGLSMRWHRDVNKRIQDTLLFFFYQMKKISNSFGELNILWSMLSVFSTAYQSLLLTCLKNKQQKRKKHK